MKRRIWLAGGALAVAGLVVGVACTRAPRPDGGEGLLEQGKPAPDLSGIDQGGVTRSVKGERGHFLLVYFYPKDGTPGCTEEACAFRDSWDRYAKADVQIFGVSGDDQASHAEFAKEHDIPFPLIADPEGTWSVAFGVASFLGMTERVSFLVNPKGQIVATYPDVDPGVHADQVLADVERLGG